MTGVLRLLFESLVDLDRQRGERMIDERDRGLLIMMRVSAYHPQSGAVSDRSVLAGSSVSFARFGPTAG